MSITKGEIFYQFEFSQIFFTIFCKFTENILLNLINIKEEFSKYYSEIVDYQTYSEQIEIIYNLLSELFNKLLLYLSSSTKDEEIINRNLLNTDFSIIIIKVFTLINLVFQNTLTNRYYTTFNVDGSFENNENFYSENTSRYLYLYQVSSKEQKRIFHHFINEINHSFLNLINDLYVIKEWNNQSGTCLNYLIETLIKKDLFQSVRNLETITNSIRDIFEYKITREYSSSAYYTDLAVFENSNLVSGYLYTFTLYIENFSNTMNTIFNELSS